MNSLLERFHSLPWASYLIDWSLRLTLAVLVLVFGLWLARQLLKVFTRVLTRMQVDPMLRDFLRNLVSGVLFVLVVVGALDQAGVPMTSIFAALGAAGLAIALALRDSLSNLAAGVMLLLLKPFRAGDMIGIGIGTLGAQTGRVESLRLMHTVLLTADNCELILPNNKVANEAIINYSARSTRRVDILIGIAYRDDIAAAFEVIRAVLQREPRVLMEPAPQLTVERLADSTVELAIRPWVGTADYATVRAQLLLELKQALAAAGIAAPGQRER